MVPKNYPNFNSCDATESREGNDSLFLQRDVQARKVLGELAFPKRTLQKIFPTWQHIYFALPVEVMQKDY